MAGTTGTIRNGVSRRQITLDGVNYTNVDARITSRYAEAIEDNGAAGSVGIQYQLPIVVDGVITGWGDVITVLPQNQPATFGDKVALQLPYGVILAQGPNVIVGIGVTAAQVICRMRGNGAATTVDFTEYQ